MEERNECNLSYWARGDGEENEEMVNECLTAEDEWMDGRLGTLS